MNILLTGATGFVGKRMLKQLEKGGIKKENIILLAGKKIEDYFCVCHKQYSYTAADFEGKQIDILIHLGAQTPKGKEKQGMTDFVSNIFSTVHLIQNLPNIPQKLIFGSSVSVYDFSEMPISEHSDLTVGDSYGLSKLICERLLEEWCEQNHICLQILRFGPIYGPGEETYNKISGAFLKQAMAGEDIHIFSDGNDLRSMIYVDDACRMIMRAMELEAYAGPINITEKRAITIRKLAELAIEVSGSTSQIVLENKGALRSETYDNQRMAELLGNTEVSYKKGMEELFLHLKRMEMR